MNNIRMTQKQAEGTVFCTNCGRKQPSDARFCTVCGTKLFRSKEDADNNTPDREQGSQAERCANCGKVLIPGNAFCTACGAKVRGGEKKSRTGIYVALLVCCIVGVAILGTVVWLRTHVPKEQRADAEDSVATLASAETQENADEAETEDRVAEEEASGEPAEEEVDEAENMASLEENADPGAWMTDTEEEISAVDDIWLERFHIDPMTVADYANCLDPAEYEYYDSGISDFSFVYPTNLYYEVTVNKHPDHVAFGTNVQNIIFFGSDGSKLSYILYKRNDNRTISEMSTFVHDAEYRYYIDTQDILNKVSDGYGKVILTGWTNEEHTYAAYDMLKIEQDYVLQMLVEFPGYASEEDRLQKAYVTECYYRMCGFSDSGRPYRSYTEFLEAQ